MSIENLRTIAPVKHEKKFYPDINSLIRNYTFEVQEQNVPPGVFMQKWLKYEVDVLGGTTQEKKVSKLTDLNQQLTEASEGKCETVRPDESILRLAKVFVVGMLDDVQSS